MHALETSAGDGGYEFRESPNFEARRSCFFKRFDLSEVVERLERLDLAWYSG